MAKSSQISLASTLSNNGEKQKEFATFRIRINSLCIDSKANDALSRIFLQLQRSKAKNKRFGLFRIELNQNHPQLSAFPARAAR